MEHVYHITHIENLPGILQRDGLWSDNGRLRQELNTITIAHEHIKRRRAMKAVPISPGGTLADYTPFYFAPRSPMLYAIHKDRVEGYQGGQGAVLHLVAQIKDIAEQALNFVFTDGHAEIDFSEFFSDLADLNKVDWVVMNSRYWLDTNQDPDRKRRRQAEFLVHQFFPWPLIVEIGVQSQSMASRVREILDSASHRPAIAVQRNWYY